MGLFLLVFEIALTLTRGSPSRVYSKQISHKVIEYAECLPSKGAGVLYILTSKQVLPPLFTGRNQLMISYQM